ncbi:hypothetical protein LH991_01285 [Schleiferilactobacillus harbinensis]|uniref:Lipoprotein n=1 Tax=Schleiferilactobacillus harbinensis DSM 16991 TaxID=1122147 RepID=A0A0R1XGG5_9LACO|nr:hypothetical protein [Schleiferilactobacillus harbinensis]KRM28785.1 hypothetical protein FC91_GL001619 [Schleiferilactobacillus harbinensis DSM 16991]QFR62716.1 hypothetical protein LH991_01285 [Schleiferilactobacillus harbinensis]
MKKILIGVAAALALFSLAGCQPKGNDSASAASAQAAQTSSSYTAIIRGGRDAVSSKAYDQALGYFQSALLTKTGDKKATALVKQTKALIEAQNSLSKNSFNAAKSSAAAVKTVTGGDSSLNSAADELLTTINKVQTAYKAYQGQLQKAQTAYDQQDYAGAIATLNQLVNQSDIADSYYATIYAGALKLQVGAVSAQNASGGTAGNGSSASSSSNAASGSGEYSVNKNDTEINGEKITAAQIQQARKDLQAQGIDFASWSDLDIMKAIKVAHADGRTKITPQDAGLK